MGVIDEGVDGEGKGLLVYRGKSGKEMSEIVGFEDLGRLRGLFKKMKKERVWE